MARLTLHLFLSVSPSFFLLACFHSVLVSCCDCSSMFLVYPPFFTHLYYSYVFPLPAFLWLAFCRLLFYSSQFKILFLGILDLSSLKLLSFRLPSPVCLAFGSLFLFSSTCAWSLRFLIRRLMMRCLKTLCETKSTSTRSCLTRECWLRVNTLGFSLLP